MASRQFLRRLSPILRTASRALPAAARSTVYASRQAVVSQNLPSHLTAVRCMSSDASLEIINVQDEEDFKKRVLEAKKPIVVDFHANWCGPCKLLGPRLENIIAEEKGRVEMAKVDIDEQVELAMRFNVQSVPTVVGFKNGKVQGTFIGLKEDDEIKVFVQSLQ